VNKEVTIKELEIQNTKLIRELEEKNFIIDELKKDDKKVKII
jgi:kinesin family protein 5